MKPQRPCFFLFIWRMTFTYIIIISIRQVNEEQIQINHDKENLSKYLFFWQSKVRFCFMTRMFPLKEHKPTVAGGKKRYQNLIIVLVGGIVTLTFCHFSFRNCRISWQLGNWPAQFSSTNLFASVLGNLAGLRLQQHRDKKRTLLSLWRSEFTGKTPINCCKAIRAAAANW